MKKYKLFILMAIFTMLSMVGVVRAADAPLTFNNYDMICTPSSIEAGGKSTCYLFAKISGGNLKLNGFVSVIYTNDNLKLDGVRAEASEVAYAKLVEPGKTASESGVTGNKYVIGEEGKADEFKCNLSWMDISTTRLNAAGSRRMPLSRPSSETWKERCSISSIRFLAVTVIKSFRIIPENE